MSEPKSAPFWYITFKRNRQNQEDEIVNVSQDVLWLETVDHEKKTDTLRIGLLNYKLDKLDSDIWERGNILTVIFGHANQLSPAREYIIKSIKGGRELQIEAHGKDTIMNTQRVREVYQNVTRSDVVKEIALRYGYTDHTFIEDTEEVHETITQHNLTDSQFLRKLAEREGFQWYIDHTGFHWHERDLGQAPNVRLIYHTDPEKGDIIDFDVENDISRRPARVTVKGRDPIKKQDIEASRSNKEDPNRDALAKFQGVIPTSGNRRQVVVDTDPVKQDEVVSSRVNSQKDAEVEAKRRYRKVVQKTVKLMLKIRGNAQITAKSVIKVDGMGKRYSGLYYVQSVAHNLTANEGFVTTLHVVTDGVNTKSQLAYNKSDKDSLLRCASLLREAYAVQGIDSSSTESDGYRLLLETAELFEKAAIQTPRQARFIAQIAVENLIALRRFSQSDQNEATTTPIYGASVSCLAVAKQLAATSLDYEETEGKLNTSEVTDRDELYLTPSETTPLRGQVTRNQVAVQGGSGRSWEFISTFGRSKKKQTPTQ